MPKLKKADAIKTEDFICLGYIKKQNNMSSLILAKYSRDDKFVVNYHVTIEISSNWLCHYSMVETECPFFKIPKGCLYAIWIEPIVCTVEYLPSEKIGFRRAVFKTMHYDKKPEECRVI
ncbi:hypothetical protein MCG44_00270 [Lawsonibacter sp. OA9]|uniref:hypothetical protein n=1 Tax=Oscillospiraceae TaxID=216572 RepID=UPI001F059341|nr:MULTISPECIES: hypothetical protein [Oscillospiraceae]MCH1978190.1 hypothetical protein [Lawsonibacter sp. OA9]MCH1982442.1 hypothetical protein [Ruminococcus sp. OA3]